MQIEDLIIESLKAFIELPFIGDTENTTSSKLVFPNKRDNQIRISEQEAKLLFIKHVDLHSSLHYSVETPTIHKYRFSGKVAKRSGNIDVCLFENGHRKHLIEFKAHNKECSFKKDFIKLIGDENGLQNYFIHVLTSTDSRTFDSIEKKYQQDLTDAFNETTPTSLLTIFVCDRKHRTIFRYSTEGKHLSIKQQIEGF